MVYRIIFDAVFTLLDPKPKGVIVMSDNGPHYHCSETMALVSKWTEWYNIECKKWWGEAKTSIDSHHAQVIIIFTLPFLNILFTQIINS
jgi:hypothetical protein